MQVEEGVVIPLPYGEDVVEELEKKETKEEVKEEEKEDKEDGVFKVTELPWKVSFAKMLFSIMDFSVPIFSNLYLPLFGPYLF